MLEPESPLVEDFIQYVVGTIIMDNIELTFFMSREDVYRRIRQNIELLLSVYAKPYVVSSHSGLKVRWLTEDDLRRAVDSVLQDILSRWYDNPLAQVLMGMIRAKIAFSRRGDIE